MHDIKVVDNVHNESTGINVTTRLDSTGPNVSHSISNEFEISGNEIGGRFRINLSITDSGSGFELTNTYYENETRSTLSIQESVVEPDGSISIEAESIPTLNGNSFFIEREAFSGFKHIFTITSIDNVGNLSSKVITVQVPHLPSSDIEDNSIVWDSGNNSFYFNGSLNVPESGMPRMNNISLVLNGAVHVNSDDAEYLVGGHRIPLSSFTRISGTNDYDINYKIENDALLNSHYHRNYPYILCFTSYGKEFYLQYETSAVVPNRPPNNSNTRNLEIISGNRTVASILNVEEIYQDPITNGSGLYTYINNKINDGFTPKTFYFNELPEIAEFRDFDGDTIRAEWITVNHDGGWFRYLFLREANSNVSTFQNYYLQNIRLCRDVEIPQASEPSFFIEGSTGQEQISPESLPDGSSVILTGEFPTVITIDGVSDRSGIESIKIDYAGEPSYFESINRSTESGDSISISVPWPFTNLRLGEGESIDDNLFVTLTDFVGNEAVKSIRLIVDDTPPSLPNGGQQLIHTGSSQNLYYQNASPDGASSQPREVDLIFNTANYINLDPRQCVNFQFEGVFDSLGNVITAITASAESDRITLTFPVDYPSNEAITLKLNLIDAVGNITPGSWTLYSPAGIGSNHIDITGIGDDDLNIPFDSWDSTNRHAFVFKDNSNATGWDSVIVESGALNNEVMVWTERGSLGTGGSESILHGGLSPHRRYSYRFIPRNNSGAYNPQGAMILTPVVGNYRPSLAWAHTNEEGVALVDSIPLVRDSVTYIGPNGTNYFSWRDRDTTQGFQDSFYPEILLNGNSLHIPEMAPDSPQAGSFTLSSTSANLAYGSTNTLTLSIIDQWEHPNGDTITPAAIQESITFIYDDKAPKLLEDLEKEDIWTRELYAWGQRGFEFGVIDDGVGTAEIIIHRYDYATEEYEIVHTFTENPTPDVNNPDVLDGGRYAWIFPETAEGQYELFYELIDRLGKSSGYKRLGLVRNDHTAPVLAQVNLQLPEQVLVDPSRYTFGTNNMRVSFQWSDNGQIPPAVVNEDDRLQFSGLAYVDWEYRDNNGIALMTGRRTLNNAYEVEPEISCMPDRLALVEGESYELFFQLTDRGGKSSEWVSLDREIVFDLTTPSIKDIQWSLSKLDGNYISRSENVPLPTIVTTDNLTAQGDISIKFNLLATDGSLIDADISSVHFPSLGHYLLEVIATDLSGQSYPITIPVIYDDMMPKNLALQWKNGDPANCFPGDRLTLGLGAEEDITAIDKYSLSFYQGAELLWTQELNPAQAENISLLVPPQGLDTLTLKGNVWDLAGNCYPSEVTLTSFTPQERTEGLSIETSLYHGIGQGVGASWTYIGPDTMSTFDIRLLGTNEGNTNTIFTTSQQVTHLYLLPDEISDLDLYETLQWQVVATSQGGRILPPFYSPIVTVDHSSPVIKTFSYPSISRLDSLPVEWEIEEDSRISSIEFLIEGISTNEQDEVITQALALIPQRQLSPMDSRNLLSDFPEEHLDGMDAVRVRLMVTDVAGNLSESISNHITLDRTEDPVFLVLDQGDYINPGENNIEFSWLLASVDPEVGESGYHYQLSINGQIDPDGWDYLEPNEPRIATYIGSDFNAPEYDGVELVLLVKRQTLAGEEEMMYSNGIVIDLSAPRISPVTLEGLPSGNMGIYYVNEPEVDLRVSALDEESGINRFQHQAGENTGGGYNPVADSLISTPFDEIAGDVVVLTAEFPANQDANSRISFEVQAFNGVDMASLPSYSPEIIYNPDQPYVRNVVISYQDGDLSVSWALDGPIPVASQSIEIQDEHGSTIYQNGIPLRIEPGAGDRSAVFEDVNLVDGSYQVEVSSMDLANRPSSNNSPILIVDNTAPTIHSSDIPDYIYDTLKLEYIFSEAVTDIHWELKSGPDQIHQWMESDSLGISSWSGEIDLASLASWPVLSLSNQRILVLSLRLRDRHGNWSVPIESNLFFDGTAPSIPNIQRDNTISWNDGTVEPSPAQVGLVDRVNKLSLTSNEDAAPIVAYQWAEVSQIGDIPSVWNRRIVPSPTRNLSFSDLELDGIYLEDGDSFYLAVRVQNQAGQYSDIGYSDSFIADLSAPEFELTWVNPPSLDENGVAVLNDSGALKVSVTGEQSQWLLARLKLLDSNGVIQNTETSKWFYWDRSENEEFQFDFNEVGRTSGIQTAQVIVKDLHGQVHSESIFFRINPEPTIQIPVDLETYPGQTLTLNFQRWILDANGINSITISRKDDPSDSRTFIWDEMDTIDFTLHQSAVSSQVTETIHEFNIEAVDNLGQSSNTTFDITVVNSQSGVMAENEYWSGTHYLLDELIVPAGVVLTIGAGTEVLAKAGDVYGQQQRIILLPGASLVHAGAATYGTTGEQAGAQWQGILSHIDLNWANVTVSGADRGLVIADYPDDDISETLSLTLNGCRFEENRIGLHLLDSNSDISNCIFQDNTFYGVKEEDSASVDMRNNTFADNGFDYYDSEENVITAIEINNLITDDDGNRNNEGNRGE